MVIWVPQAPGRLPGETDLVVGDELAQGGRDVVRVDVAVVADVVSLAEPTLKLRVKTCALGREDVDDRRRSPLGVGPLVVHKHQSYVAQQLARHI